MPDPDLEIRGGRRGGGLQKKIFRPWSKNKGNPGTPGLSLGSATDIWYFHLHRAINTPFLWSRKLYIENRTKNVSLNFSLVPSN